MNTSAHVPVTPLTTHDTTRIDDTRIGAVRPLITPALLDNLRAHKDPRVRWIIQSRGARVHFLPPYSYDYNPIESAWALLKKRIRAFAPRTVGALRQVARAARHVVQPHHCRQWFQHCGYANSSTIRG